MLLSCTYRAAVEGPESAPLSCVELCVLLHATVSASTSKQASMENAFKELDLLTDQKAVTLAFSDSDSESILSLFPRDVHISALLSDVSLSFANRLESLMKKEVRTTLHGSTLSQYWLNKRIPRGLRINKEPALGRNDSEFCKKWCAILNKCSLDLMLLVIQYAKDEQNKVKTELDGLHNEMKEKISIEQLQETEAKCAKTIETFEKKTLEMKMQKYKRDTLDYKNGRVYPWLSSTGTAHQRRGPEREEFGASSVTSTEESESEQSTSTGPFLGPRYPFRSRGDLRGGGAGVNGRGGTATTGSRKRMNRRL